MHSMARSGLVLSWVTILAACTSAAEPTAAEPTAAEPTAAERSAAEMPEAAAPSPSTARIAFVEADGGDVFAQVASLVSRAHAEGRAPLVYVGATWCEPCQYFHAAALRGDLDGELPPLLLLEFDRDRDGERLDAAGYSSRMIPLFVVPSEDGRPSDAHIEGSIHGPGSPAQIVPRLLAILGPTGAIP